VNAFFFPPAPARLSPCGRIASPRVFLKVCPVSTLFSLLLRRYFCFFFSISGRFLPPFFFVFFPAAQPFFLFCGNRGQPFPPCIGSQAGPGSIPDDRVLPLFFPNIFFFSLPKMRSHFLRSLFNTWVRIDSGAFLPPARSHHGGFFPLGRMVSEGPSFPGRRLSFPRGFSLIWVDLPFFSPRRQARFSPSEECRNVPFPICFPSFRRGAGSAPNFFFLLTNRDEQAFTFSLSKECP